MTIVDIYCRVSTQMQAEEGHSIGEQEELLKAYANANGWVINAVLKDPGYTGANMMRPALQQLINDVQSKKCNQVLVYKLDRLSRSQKEMLYLIEDVFIKNKCGFISMTEAINTDTPLGIATIGILSAFAQLEKSNIAQRMIMGRDARVKGGTYSGGGKIPIGYEYSKEQQKLIPLEYDSVMIRNIFQWYNSGTTCNQIAKKLNTEYSWRNERKWTASHITRILRNPVYIGRMQWKGEVYESNHEAIIDAITWERVQAELDRRTANTEQGQTPYAHTTLLGGLLWCSHCNRRYMGVKDHKSGVIIHRYYCAMRLNEGRIRGIKCKNKGWRDDELDYLILNEIKKLSTDRSLIDTAETSINEHDAEISAIKARISDIDKQIERCIELYSLGNIDATVIQKRINKLNTDKEKLNKQLQRIEADKPQDVAPMRANLDTFAALVDNVSDRMMLYQLVHQLIKRINLDGENIEIIWNI